ncbi:DNA-binding NarL/FixJ family response regulator [Pelomonas saccharophila]|uniref:DNA-binding NarL/FixJ family response regulator n=1 Tax=Roseateles saccharophilus TaxID=304 RepID=A0ABU1YR43_ROSSA|nr:response regulator transcription factor [Roseateles saccharophilus]MDR7271327.1 DNA-binding NarL/FixJ family response regulator [Roseateles saccharophilus]
MSTASDRPDAGQPEAGRRTRVMIADDHALVREGLRKVLELDPTIELAGEAATASEVLWHLQRLDVDLVLLDLLMPGCTDVDLIERIVKAHPKLPVLVLTMHADPHIARRALEAGAGGYLTKDISTELLIEAVHQVAAGRSYVDPTLSAALIRPQAGVPQPLDQLSARERQVLVALVQGRALVDIAADMNVAPNTVSTYKSRLMEKLGQNSLSDLVRYSIKLGLTG